MIIENVTSNVDNKIFHDANDPWVWFPTEKIHQCSWCHYYADSVIQSTCNIQDCSSSVSAYVDSWLTGLKPGASNPPRRPRKSLHSDVAAKPPNVTLLLLEWTACGSQGLVRVMANKWESSLKVTQDVPYESSPQVLCLFHTRAETQLGFSWVWK